MRILSREYKENVRELDSSLRVEKSFDLIKRSLKIGKDEATFYYIDGFVKDVVMQRIMQYFLTLKDLCNGEEAAECFRERHVPYVEVDISTDIDALVLAVLSGSVVMLGSTFGAKAIIIDARSYPARNTEEPNNDRVMQGAKDGFVETLIFNTALIRRRIRDPRLTVTYKNAGGSSKTDMAICYMDGIANEKYVEGLSKKLDEIAPSSMTMGAMSLAECLIKRRWYNPFPKIRTLERPDAAAAELMEGKVIVICDTSPQVLVLPTSIFDFWQETNDYYFPPLTGCYLRLIRHATFLLSLILTPTWLLLLQNAELLPSFLEFIIPEKMGKLPIFLQLILCELAIDGLKLASMNTPNMLSHSLSVIGGLILGDFAVGIGWLSGEVIFYSAVVAITGFSQQNYELGYAFKFLRMLLLISTALFGIYGYAIGLLVVPVLLVTNKTANGEYSYLYPLIPFNGKALIRLYFRVRKNDFEDKNEKKLKK
jgi:stage V sporulation protein AF